MNEQEQRALVSICLMAAFADGSMSERERAEIKRIVERHSGPGIDLSVATEDVLLRRANLKEVAGQLGTPDLRKLAYEMAVCACSADEALNEAEKLFLAELRKTLQLPADETAAFEREAQSIAAPPLLMKTSPSTATLNDAALDRMILNYSILNGALELLPHSLATMAIIPLQMKMVYRVGQDYGYELDRGHLKDFLATAGVGLTSQVVEGFAQKLISGLVGRTFGRIGRGVAGQVTSSVFAFATTYALGQAAKRYYAGGRTLGAIQIKELFDNLLTEGKTLQAQYLPEIQQKAQQVNMRDLLPIITGQH